ncbi:hypothetical protein FB45DRAFT_1112803 [Roridomyces roridus]|uniref:Uncharacterized protein n=1 Tax=Roridomyces roridus TaxID=1738132 RepID=A0AAD7FAZ5_9AGAR|nr:hypothetical protein FB45DRAFT_1112803 [Roridomyces roridus]
MRHPPLESKTFARVLAFYLTRAFENGCVLSTVFSFPASDAIPEWANEEAHLVALNPDNEHTIVGYHVPPLPGKPLGVEPATLNGVSAWLDGQQPAAFCFFRTQNPDLLFVLRLSNGDMVRVVLHAAVADAVPGGEEVQKLFHCLTDENLFDETSPGDPSSASLIERLSASPALDRRMHVLRVLATFPAHADVATSTAPAPKGAQVCATLDAAHLQTVMEGIPASDVFSRVVSSVTAGFLRHADKEEEGIVGQKRKVAAVPDDAAGKRARYDEVGEQGKDEEDDEERSKGVPLPVSARSGAEKVGPASSTTEDSESSGPLAGAADVVTQT